MHFIPPSYPPFPSCFVDVHNLSDFELAEMPSCNLAEMFHNKWLRQSSNPSNDLYVATVDDFIKAFM
jgi:hypothetical protein